PGDDERIGVPGRSDELDPEPPDVPADGVEHVEIRLGGAVAAGAHLPQAERAPEEPAEFFVQGGGQADLFLTGSPEHEVFPPPRRRAVVAGPGNGAVFASIDAGITKQTPP